MSRNGQAEWPLWEVFVRPRPAWTTSTAAACTRPTPKMAMQMARDVYTRRQEGTSVWVVRSEHIVASDPGDKDMLFDPADDKVYRHPTFYKLPDAWTTCDDGIRSLHRSPRRPAAALPAAPGRHLPDPRAAPGEWCGHAPVLEEDIALANMALDLIGQARALLTRPAAAHRPASTRTSSPSCATSATTCNPTLVELPHAADGAPGGDFAFTVLRNLLVATLAEAAVAAAAASAATPSWPPSPPRPLKEARYHQQHAADWVVRLGDGTDESPPHAGRAGACSGPTWPNCSRPTRSTPRRCRQRPGPALGRACASLAGRESAVLAEATLRAPRDRPSAAPAPRRAQRAHGLHLLAEMQSLQRAYPGGVW
jgi:ring-1,2-phenylacetyl-CoA epoxidase subunit PaaC